MSFVVTLPCLMSTLLTLSLFLYLAFSLSHFKEKEESSASRGLPTHRPPGEVRERKKKEEEKDNWRDWTVGSFWREERPNSAPRTAITDMGSHWGKGRRGIYEKWKKKLEIWVWNAYFLINVLSFFFCLNWQDSFICLQNMWTVWTVVLSPRAKAHELHGQECWEICILFHGWQTSVDWIHHLRIWGFFWPWSLHGRMGERWNIQCFWQYFAGMYTSKAHTEF